MGNKKKNVIGRRAFVAATPSLTLGTMALLSGCAGDDPARAPEPDSSLPMADSAVVTPDAALAVPDSRPPRPDTVVAKPDAAPVPANRVVELTDTKAVSSSGKLDSARVRTMVRTGLLQLSGAATLKAAWKLLLPSFSPGQRVGIKLNCLNASVANSPEMVSALVETLVADLGAQTTNIVVWDRSMGELSSCGFTSSKMVGGARLVGTEKPDGGPGYDATAHTVHAGRKVRFSGVLTSSTDVTINCGVLKDHELSGITGALKNSYGCIDDPGQLHGMNPDMPALNALAPLKKRMKLFINEGLVASATGGPVGPATHAPGKMLFSRDPVAIDTHQLALINAMRPTTKPVEKQQLAWLDEAQKRGLGSRNPAVVAKIL